MTESGKSTHPLTGVALAAALVVMASWLVLLGWLVLHTDAVEVTWARWLTVLAALESVAFAAAGALFGTAVQRQRAVAAEHRADKAEGEARINATAAANGRALASVVKSRARKAPVSAPASGVERVAVPRDTADDELAALANRLFPD